jgi:hypothetical protein
MKHEDETEWQEYRGGDDNWEDLWDVHGRSTVSDFWHCFQSELGVIYGLEQHLLLQLGPDVKTIIDEYLHSSTVFLGDNEIDNGLNGFD